LLIIDKIIENIDAFNAESMEYKVNYLYEGEMYAIKMSVKKIDNADEKAF